jgi:hypothetical protein
MKFARLIASGFCLTFLLQTLSPAAELFISELLFNPPGSDGATEYIELRGTPNLVLPNGTYLVGVEGDAEENPGTVQDVFDLSGRQVGQNGFLLLLPKAHRYKPNPLASVLVNSGVDNGWGSGSLSSSLRHRGERDQTEIENPSCTFFLIQAPASPGIGDDIDADDDGVPSGATFDSWTILDSVGILDNGGKGDISYGQISFRRSLIPGVNATASGVVVPVPFTPSYVARNGNTSDWAATNWVASENLLGSPPTWFLGANSSAGGTNTWPPNRAKAPLNHLGGPNFKAPLLPAVLVRESGTNTVVSENGLKDSYLLSLATSPTGAVTLRIRAEPPVLVSVDGGASYSAEKTLNLANKTPRKVIVRTLDDGAAGPSELTAFIRHDVYATADPFSYPTNTLVRDVAVKVRDTNLVLLSEVKVNPPGAEDAPFEFIELRGTPGRRLTNLWLVVVQGNSGVNPGRIDLAVELSDSQLGTNGLLVLAGPGHPYTFASGTSVKLLPAFATAGGALDNGTLSLLLIGTKRVVVQGADWDNGDNGILEGLPDDAFIVDAVGWSDGGNDDKVYGGVDLTQSSFTPDAVMRLPNALTPRSAPAWAAGDLAGATGESLSFVPDNISTNAVLGAMLTPGIVNRATPYILPNPLIPLSGVIDDPDNALARFTIRDDDTPLTNLTVSASSTNPAVVPNANLTLTRGANGAWTLGLRPVGVGYSQIILTVSDGVYARHAYLDYAASAPGRPGGVWHTGVSDASTAIAIDANWMFVGDDENQFIGIYSRTRSGPPVAGQDFSSVLRLVDRYTNGLPKEVDIEASTRVGNRLYWLGSHSHAFDASERTNRARLFGADLSGTGTNAVMKVLAHYDFLQVDLLDWDAKGLHGKGANYYGLVESSQPGVHPKTPDGSGFNIEGLCMAPGSTSNAYVAFRAPLIPPGARAKALLIPVRNFAQLASKAHGPGRALFGAPIELNLGGRGVRSIEGNGTNYLIVAGPPGAGDDLPPPGNFKLFTWSGQTNDVPQEHDANLTGLNPEGIVEVGPGPWSATNLFQIISDNGTNRFYGPDVDGKDYQAKELVVREFKKFRVDSVALGNVVALTPTIRSVVASSAEMLTVTWFSREGTRYGVQTKALWSDAWRDLSQTMLATDALTSLPINAPADSPCFLRIRVIE